MASDAAATQPELIGFQWARVEAHPSIFPVVLDGTVSQVENLIMKRKASLSFTVSRRHAYFNAQPSFRFLPLSLCRL